MTKVQRKAQAMQFYYSQPTSPSAARGPRPDTFYKIQRRKRELAPYVAMTEGVQKELE